MAESEVEEYESDSNSDMDVDSDVNHTNQTPSSNSNGKIHVSKIKIDNKLELSKNMKDVETQIKPKVKNYVKLDDKLRCNIPAFPSDYALVKLASMAYSNSDKQLDLPNGWQFLTAAWNSDLSNGYYGCAYFNEEHQQIVIAHRGTYSLNAVWNDLKGIFYTKFVAQMNSAATFADMILSLIKKFNENGAYLKLSFTGHSLGGWLAQVTTFTAKYLTTDEDRNNQFSLIRETQFGYHAHSVVFDSPGCKQMLKQLKTKYITYRYGDVKSTQMSINSLDITTYLSAPNRINCCNAHVGKLYRIFVNLSGTNSNEHNKRWRVTNWALSAAKVALNWGRRRLLYTIDTHGLNRIIECFDPHTGLVKRDGEGRLEVQEVLNWPIIEGIVSAGSEYNQVFRWASRFENYRPPVNQSYSDNCEIRYHTKHLDENNFKFNVFNDVELSFVKGYDIRRFFPKYESVIFSFETDDDKHVLNSAIEMLDSMKFEIDRENQFPLLDPEITPSQLISYVKQLIHFFPNLNRVKQTRKSFTVDLVTKIYQTESVEYSSSIRLNSLEFDVSSFNLRPFLIKGNSQVLLQVEKDTSVGVLKIYKIFQLVKAETKFSQGNSMFLDVKTSSQLKQLSFASIVEQIRDDYLIVIENNENSKAAVDNLREIFGKVQINPKIKVILIVDEKIEINWEDIVGKCEKSHHEGIRLCDLSSDSRKQILKRTLINFQGHRVSLAQLIPGVEKLQSAKDLIKIAMDNNRGLDVGSDYLRNSRFDVFAASNITLEEFRAIVPPGERLTLYKDWNPSVMVRFVVLNDDQAENQFENICWYLSHKSRIHWLSFEGNQLILKDSISRYNGESDELIENLFTEKFYRQVHEVLNGCFVIGDNVDNHVDKLIEKLFSEEFHKKVHEVLRGCFASGEDTDNYEFFEDLFTEIFRTHAHEVFRVCLVTGEDDDNCELIKKVFGDVFQTQLYEMLRGCFATGEDGDYDKFIKKLYTKNLHIKVLKVLCGLFVTEEEDPYEQLVRHDQHDQLEGHYQYRNYGQDKFITKLFSGKQEVLSGCFVRGEGKKSISSNGTDLLKLIISSEVLMRLGAKEEIKTGSELTQLGDIKDYYIKRTLTKPAKLIESSTLEDNKNDIYAICHSHIIRFEWDFWVKILDDDRVMLYNNWVLLRNFGNVKFIILDEKEAKSQFNRICEFYPNKNIHYLNRAWKQDYVYKDSVDNPIYGRKRHSSNDWCTHEQLRIGSNEPDVLELVDGQVAYTEKTTIIRSPDVLSMDNITDSVVTVKGMPGMGKSTFFTHLALHKKKLYPFLWVIKLKLHTIPWDHLVKLKKPLKKERVMEFFVQILNLNSEFEKSLFEYCLYDEKVVLILDAFDEVSPKYDNQIFGLLETLQTEMKLKQLWLSSRPYALKDEHLKGVVYTLQGFDGEGQRWFFIQFWTKYLSFNIDRDDCITFSRRFLQLLPRDLNQRLIAGIPLILKVLAEYYQAEFEMFCQSNKEIQLQELSIHKFYDAIIDKNIHLLYGEKLATDTKKQAADIESKKRRRTTLAEHKLLALLSCHLDSFVTDQRGAVNDLIEGINNGEEITGFISGVENGVPQFIHATFAEYFAALWLIEQMIATEDKGKFLRFFNGIVKLFVRGSEVVYSLFDGQLGDNKLLEEKLTKHLQENKDVMDRLFISSKSVYLNIIRFIEHLDADYNTIYNFQPHPLADAVKREVIDELEHIFYYIYGDECDFKSIIMKYNLLHVAAKTNANGTMTSFLLSKVRQDNLLDVLNHMPDGSSPLHVAAENVLLQVVKVLIENGAEVSLRDKYGFTALDLAVSRQQKGKEIVELLLDNWVVTSPLDFLKTCESIRVIDVIVTFMKYVSKCFGQVVESSSTVDEPGKSKLVGSPNHSLINSLITSGTDEISGIKYDLTLLLHSECPVVHVSDVINAACNHRGNERLFLALIGCVALKYPNYLSKLFYLKNREGDTLLHMAARLGYVATAELMVGLGAQTDIRNDKRETALSIAANCGNLDFVLCLLRRKDEVFKRAVNLIDLKSSTSDLLVQIIEEHLCDQSDLLTKRYDGGDLMLHIAAQLGDVKAAKIIIDRGADVNVRNDDNHTPLSLACKNGHPHMVKLLIDEGASVNDDQQSPLLWAICSCSFRIVEIVIEKGADVNAGCPFPLAITKCMNVWRPLQLAVDRYKCLGDYAGLAYTLLLCGADVSSCFNNMPFDLTEEYADVIIVFVMFGADIYATNHEGVSLVTHLEKHWHNQYMISIFLSVILFSKCKLPEQLLETLRDSAVMSSTKAAVAYVMKFKTQLKEKIPELYMLIKACKLKDIRAIQQHLHAVLKSESELNRVLNHVDELILSEIPFSLPSTFSITFTKSLLDGCIQFLYLSIDLFTKCHVVLSPDLTFYNQLKSLSEHCDEFCNNKET